MKTFHIYVLSATLSLTMFSVPASGHDHHDLVNGNLLRIEENGR